MTSLRTARSEEESCIQCEKYIPSSTACRRAGMIIHRDDFSGLWKTTCDHFKDKEADE